MAIELRKWAPFGLLVALAALLFLYLGTIPAPRIGDGAEYLCMTENWARHGTPWLSAEFRTACSGSTPGFIDHGSTFDAVHFWVLPLFTAPFFYLFGASGSYVALHFVLFGVALCVLYRRYGGLTAVSCGFLLAASPLLWWMNKAHAETFVCLGLVLAFAEIGAGRWLNAAVWAALAATQQVTFAPVAVVCLVFWLHGARFERKSRSELIRVAAVLALIALPTAYSWFRHQQLSPFVSTNSVDSALISFHRAFSLYIDPDIGLAAHWPLAIPALACLAFVPLRLTLMTIGFLAIEPVLVSAQRNWNSGGTLHLSRYALYLIPPLIVCAGLAIARIPGRFRLGAGALLVALIGLYGLEWNSPRFHPEIAETYLSHTKLAEWLYREHPGWYDPVPEVFVERGIYNEIGDMPKEPWAVGVPSCGKLFLLQPPASLPKITGKPANPAGCLLPNEADLFYGELASGTRRPNARGYVNLP